MSKKIDVIVIDPHNQKITTEVVTNNENPANITSLIDCRCFDVVRLGGNVIMYIDDEGLLIENRYFKLVTKDHTEGRCYAGKALLACDDGKGNTISFDRNIDTIEKITKWMPKGYKEEPYMQFVSFS
jgi:hypothetical protein